MQPDELGEPISADPKPHDHGYANDLNLGIPLDYVLARLIDERKRPESMRLYMADLRCVLDRAENPNHSADCYNCGPASGTYLDNADFWGVN